MQAKSLEKYPIIKPGQYNGLWSGFFVDVMLDGESTYKHIKLNRAVKGLNCKCAVVVDEEGFVSISECKL